jgi:cysteine synthase B
MPVSLSSPRAASSVQLLELIGHTPLLSLRNLEPAGGTVRLFAKAEWFNPGGSVKDRAAASIISHAEADGRLVPGRRILDASSGNTAIAYAMIAAAKGIGATLCVPRNANPQVIGLLNAYGAELVLTDPLHGSDGAIREARRIAAQDPDRFVYLDQYGNPANWKAHYQATAVEIWEQTHGTVTHFVAGLGTTGTFIGTTRRLKTFNPQLRAIAVQPDDALHGLEGLKHLASALVPGIYDASVPDETCFMPTELADEAAQRLVEAEGVLAGPSSGAALAASLRLAESLVEADQDAVIVMVFPDAGARYAAENV